MNKIFEKRKIISVILALAVCVLSGCEILGSDVKSFVNEVTLSAMPANVKIVTETSSFYSESTAVGSGVIFFADDNYIYILTNNHVVNSVNKGIETRRVYDFKGNAYTAKLLCSSAEYDLAVLRINIFDVPDGVTLKVLRLAEINPVVNASTASMGQPDGQLNALLLGKVIGYQTIIPDPDTLAVSSIQFQVIYHDTPILNGSSGGALLDRQLNIVGINFAGVLAEEDKNTQKDFSYACAVPCEKVAEFLIINKIAYKTE